MLNRSRACSLFVLLLQPQQKTEEDSDSQPSIVIEYRKLQKAMIGGFIIVK